MRTFLVAASLAVWSTSVLALAPGPKANIGQAPEADTAARDISASFKLPPLRDQAGGDLATRVAGLQLGKRAHELKLNARSAPDAWGAANATLQAGLARIALASAPAAAPEGTRTFAGTRASELNALLRDPGVPGVKVTSPKLEVDQPVLIHRTATFWLDLGNAELRAANTGAGGPAVPRFLLRVEGSAGVTVSGGVFAGGEWGTLVTGGKDVTLLGGFYSGLVHGGVVFTDTRGAILAHAHVTRNGGAGVLLHGNTAGALLIDNEIAGNLGPSNWHAGIVLSDRNGPVADDPQSILHADQYGVVEQPIYTRLHPPRGNVFVGNQVLRNASSGIYSDGGVQSVIFNNTVEGNAKEGVCLDNGSTGNVLAMNLVRLNGKRWGKTDAELKLDFVDGVGRVADGSSAAKTPGISLDNSLYNIIYANQVDHNYGGGIKMVRTAFFNQIGLNIITDNNEGANEHYHFFGIELGAATADVAVSDLDFTPSRGNLIFGNVIRGSHYAGIFLGLGSTDNDMFDNSIFGATNWAIEQVHQQPNSSLNNLTNLPSRNVDAGIDPALLKITKGRFD